MKKKILTLALVLSLLAALVIPASVALAQNDTDVGGDVISGMTFSAPSAVDLGDMSPGAAPSTASSTDGRLDGNNTIGYTVTGTDANGEAASTGRMWVGGSAASPTNMIAAKLKIGPATNPTADADTTVSFVNTDAPTGIAVELHVSQIVAYTDTVADLYAITITFTALAK